MTVFNNEINRVNNLWEEGIIDSGTFMAMILKPLDEQFEDQYSYEVLYNKTSNVSKRDFFTVEHAVYEYNQGIIGSEDVVNTILQFVKI